MGILKLLFHCLDFDVVKNSEPNQRAHFGHVLSHLTEEVARSADEIGPRVRCLVVFCAG